MDELATKHGLGHWSCTDPIEAKSWLRSDGEVMVFSDARPLCKDHDLADIVVSHVFDRLRAWDFVKPIGKDWQQPETEDGT